MSVFTTTCCCVRPSASNSILKRQVPLMLAGGALGIGGYYVTHLETVPMTGK
jgi:hypothetical protein